MTANKLKKLPIGKQTFERLITSNSLYVDKTKYLHELIEQEGRYFLSRPRRFGKSLTCSTLAAILEGKRELFKGLAIDKKSYAWKKHVVLILDFGECDYETPQELKISLDEMINEYAATYRIKLTKTLLKGKFAELIKRLKEKYGPIAVIVDEYDKPLLDSLPDIAKAKKIQEVLRNFYSVFKAIKVDAAVDFLFITGVTKFAKTSIFSAINNLQELTLDEKYAALVGYTDDEVDRYLKGHIQAHADKEQQPYDEIRKKIRAWYNGFQFSENTAITVYNPFSLHNCLTEKRFSDYWFRSGTPTFIIDFIENNPAIASVLPGLELEVLSSSNLDAFPLDFYYKQYKSLFVQAGYLTIRSYNPVKDLYTLKYPNEEVRRAMTNQIMDHVCNVTIEQFGDHVARFRTALAAYDMEKFCSLLSDFYKLIPYVVHSEKWYQNVFFLICKFLGFDITVEEPTNIGRIDAVLRLPAKTLVIELKRAVRGEGESVGRASRTTARRATEDVALKQIEARGYCEKFQIDTDKPIVMVGMAFAGLVGKGKAKRGISLRWKIKEVKKGSRGCDE